MRCYAAVLTGVLAQVASMAYMWLYTDMEAINMLFWSVICYFAGLMVFMAATEPRKEEKEEKEWKFKVYDLRKEWEDV